MDDQRPRVCFFVGGKEGGGVATCIQQMIPRVDRARYDVRVATCALGPFAEALRAAGLGVDDLGIGLTPLLRRQKGQRFVRVWSAHAALVFWLLRAVYALVRYVREQRIDVIHANYYPQFLVTALVILFVDVKLVWHWHGVAAGGLFGRLAPILRPLLRRSVWFIAISEATRASLEPIAGPRVSVVYNGIEIGAPLRRRAELRRALGVRPETLVVGLVASLNPIKAHRVFIEAAGEVCRGRDDVCFVYVGGHNVSKVTNYYQGLLNLRKALGLEQRLHLLGHRNDALELMSGFDLNTVTTRPPGEGFGLVIIEAMSQEVAVISTDVGAPRELIRHGETGWLVPPENSRALAEAIEQLLSDPQRRAALASAGYRMCRERFDIRATMRGVEAAYAAALGLGRDGL